MTQTPPNVRVEPARRSLWERASVVWLVPLMALLIALGVAWQTWSDRGPLITITFDEAQGVHARETELRYRDVTVGVVEDVGFSSDLQSVAVDIRLNKDIAPFVDDDAAFWVVSPQVTAQGVSGLDTVLSGVFIEGVWDRVPEGLIPAHRGLTDPPLLRPGQQGRVLTLRSLPGASLTEGTPVLYKGIAVGRVGKTELAPGETAAQSQIVIFSPYDQQLTTATRFWDTSGFSFSIGAGGVELDFSSIASLIAGGVAFETLASGGVPVRDNALFDVFGSESLARESLFSDNSRPGVNLTVIFEDNVSGLSIGSPVELGGVQIGEVISVSGILDPLRFRDQRVRLMVNIEIRPGQLGMGDLSASTDVMDFLDARVAEGLRARLATTSILTGGLKIELVTTDESDSALLDFSGDPFPILPSTDSDIADAAATAQGVLNRVNNLPVEELLQSAIRFLDGAAALTNDPELTAVPGEVRALLGDVRGVVGSEAVQALPAQLSALMLELQGATTDLRAVAADLQAAQAVDRLLAAVDATSAAATAVTDSVTGVPELIASLNTVAQSAADLPLTALVDQATSVVSAADGLLRAPGTQALPDQLGAALQDLQGVLADLRGVTTDLNDTQAVERLLAAVDAASVAATAVTDSVTGVPELIASLNGVAQSAADLPLTALVEQATGVVDAAEQLLRNSGTQELPGQLASALDEVRQVLADLRAGGTVDSLNATLGSARDAAAAIETAAQSLPDISARLNRVLSQATETLEGFEAGSELNRSARGALSEIERAARAVESLAKALERRPNSIILGR